MRTGQEEEADKQGLLATNPHAIVEMELLGDAECSCKASNVLLAEAVQHGECTLVRIHKVDEASCDGLGNHVDALIELEKTTNEDDHGSTQTAPLVEGECSAPRNGQHKQCAFDLAFFNNVIQVFALAPLADVADVAHGAAVEYKVHEDHACQVWRPVDASGACYTIKTFKPTSPRSEGKVACQKSLLTSCFEGNMGREI